MSSSGYSEIVPYVEAAEELRRNLGQWTAYESTGNCVVVAGPGSGKTKLLTIKMARILAEDVEAPQGAACITYNTECARELSSRLNRLGVAEGSRVFIGTSHGFCLQHVLRPYAGLLASGLPEALKVASANRQDTVLQRAMDERLTYAPPPVSEFRVTMDRYRRTFLDRTTSEWRERDAEVAAVIERYEEVLHADGFIDFDDMVLTGLKLLQRHGWVRNMLRAKFPVLLVDEYQDLGHALHQIVLLLLESGVRLLAVGDPDQSIYGFTGADPRLLEELCRMPDIERIPLRLNYRSRRLIVRGSQIVLQEDRGYEPAPSVNGADEEGLVQFVECPSGLEEQADITFDRVIPEAMSRRRERSLGDIAVLYPDRNVGQVVAQAANSRGIPVIRIDQGAAYPRTPLTRWLEDCAKWCAGGWREGTEPSLSSILNRWEHFGKRETSESSRWQQKVDLTSFLWHHREPDMPLLSWLEELSEALLGDSFASESANEDEVEVWERLLDTCSEDGPLSNWTVARFSGQVGAPDHLNLITLHSAKGLEFDVVVMIGMDQGRIPSWAASTEEAKREPRRLFYVGMTRARHEVHMMYSGFTVNRYGRRFDNGPSEFLLELQQSLARQEERSPG
jgi:DNA helicase-2/ATP-dependent DNA helicase PcrA